VEQWSIQLYISAQHGCQLIALFIFCAKIQTTGCVYIETVYRCHYYISALLYG